MANKETVEEIIAGLEAMGNYIPISEVTRREYRNALLKEYEEFIDVHERKKRSVMPPDTTEGGANQ